VSGVPEEKLALGWREAVKELADSSPKAFDGALFVFSQMRFEL
jgi:hypothetical protein